MYILKLRAAAASIVAQSVLPMTAAPDVVQVVPSAALLKWPRRINYGRGDATYKAVDTGFTIAPVAA